MHGGSAREGEGCSNEMREGTPLRSGLWWAWGAGASWLCGEASMEARK